MRNRTLSTACWATVVCLMAIFCGSAEASAGKPSALTAEQATVVEVAGAVSLPGWLRPADRDLVTRAAEFYRLGQPEKAKPLWQKVVQANFKAHPVIEIASVSRWMVRTAFLAAQPGITQTSADLQQLNRLKADIREYITMLKDQISNFPPPPATTVMVDIMVIIAGKLVPQGQKALTKEEIQNIIGNMEKELDKATDASAAAVLDLQVKLQKQGQLTLTIAATMTRVNATTNAILQGKTP